jgi:hypothetical protein
MRRQSLVEEIKDKDPQYASTRLKTVLTTMNEKDRYEVLTNYERKSHQFRDKNFFLASLLDGFFDRKDKMKEREVSNNQKVTNHNPPPLSGIRNAVNFTSVSSPTALSKDSIGDSHVCDYKFVKTLGKGTFGKVKLAEHMITKKLVIFFQFQRRMFHSFIV